MCFRFQLLECIFKVALLATLCAFATKAPASENPSPATAPAIGPPPIVAIDPPEHGFFTKRLDFDGIEIEAASVVSDQAMIEGWRRISMELEHLPSIHQTLARRGAQLHIIGKDQNPSDLPELRRYKDRPFDGKLTIDQRTRGVGGLLTSCGEENLLRLPQDRYHGRDICIHEFAHCIRNFGMPESIRIKFDEQRHNSMKAGLWVGAYAGTNNDEFFAELSMWYFGTHGDLHMDGNKPTDGRDGLRLYDPEAFALFDDFYSGKMVPTP
jgi:alpha-glucosidase